MKDYPYFYFIKYLGLLLTCFSFSISSALYAQTPKQIEDDLIKSFKKIEYYGQRNDYEKTSSANDEFETKLKSYAEKITSTLTYPFDALKKAYVDVSTSSEGLFRIYHRIHRQVEPCGRLRTYFNINQLEK